jgi:C4-dicarboxylate-specific signal transduction histidine kinase
LPTNATSGGSAAAKPQAWGDDASDRSQNPETINAQTQRLAALGFMVAGVCHEVSNPLAAVHSMLQILQSKRGVTPEVMEKGLASISANVARVLAITRKLGDFSRAADEPPTPVGVDSAMEDALALLRHSPYGVGVRVVYRGAPGARVLSRPGSFQQVLLNILQNAAQAMHGGGAIDASARIEDERVFVRICDSGPGIPAETLPRVFEPFFTTKAPGQGTGLGLAISYEIAHELGGTIHASNRAQGGACFDVVLPLLGE